MLKAHEAFQEGKIESDIEQYSVLIKEGSKDALLNRASAFYTSQQYGQCLEDLTEYLQINAPRVEAVHLYVNSLVKTKAVLNEAQKKMVDKCKKLFEGNAKLKQLLKSLDETQIAENEEEFMVRVFEKLLCNPKIRSYVKEESFLTKVQKMIRNPSLASVLIKMDPRLAEVQEDLMMALEQQ